MKDMHMNRDLDRRSVLAALGGVALTGAASHFGFATSAASSELSGPIAKTEFGQVRGVGGKVLAFRGIPYGGSASGANRFCPPQPPAPWKGVKDATRPGPRSMQLSDKTLGGQNIFTSPILGPYFSGGRSDAALTVEPLSEDCLVLNVLTPSLHGRRAVMVYIHGGGFAQG